MNSINLLKVLLKEKGIAPQWQPLPDYDSAPEKNAVLLIGDPAIRFRQSGPTHHIWDLGQAWKECFQLPFVYAVWAIRESCAHPTMLKALQEAKVSGVQHLDELVQTTSRFDEAFRSDYLGKAIRYDLGAPEKEGIECFIRKLAALSDHKVYAPRYVSTTNH